MLAAAIVVLGCSSCASRQQTGAVAGAGVGAAAGAAITGETYTERDPPCREFRMKAEVGRGWEEVYGTACRQSDGSWRMMPD